MQPSGMLTMGISSVLTETGGLTDRFGQINHQSLNTSCVCDLKCLIGIPTSKYWCRHPVERREPPTPRVLVPVITYGWSYEAVPGVPQPCAGTECRETGSTGPLTRRFTV